VPRLNEQDLARITAAAANLMSCECPRHLSEILMTAGSFERYSAQCASRNPKDAQLHRDRRESRTGHSGNGDGEAGDG
jgi:hypothetical protein